MSDEPIDQAVEGRTPDEPVSPEPIPPPPERPSPRVDEARRSRAMGVALALLLLVVVAVVLLSPFWAPPLMPLLPWSENASAGKLDALAARVSALEQRPAPAPVDLDPIKSAQTAAEQRLDGIERTVDALRQNQDATPGIKSSVAELTQRVDALAAQSAAQAASLQKIEQELAQRSAAGSDLAARLAALEHQLRAQAGADRAGSVMLLSLLQMREAVQQGRRFPAAYAAFEQIAAGNPDLAAAAKPLADIARDGVPSLAQLTQGFADLSKQAAVAVAPATAKRKWWDQALDRLRGLVTVRRIDANGRPAADSIEAARTDLAAGDLPAAIAAIEQLDGARAKTAQPWLRMARQRLAAETALSQLQQALTGHLGSPAGASPAVTAPPPDTAPVPTGPKTPS
jgi:hypothetical protein